MYCANDEILLTNYYHEAWDDRKIPTYTKWPNSTYDYNRQTLTEAWT